MTLRMFTSFLPHAYPRARRKSYIVENGLGKSEQTFQCMFQRHIQCQKNYLAIYSGSSPFFT